MPDTLTTAAQLRKEYVLHADIATDDRMSPCIGAASRRLKAWVGAAVYNDALAAQPQDALRALDLKTAEGMLAMHFALPRLNTNVSPKGGVLKTTKESGSVSAPIVTTYLSPAEVKQLADIYFAQAEETARPYMLSDGTPDAEFLANVDEDE